ncbi:hypothetical protein Aduo_006592 [Ancylostoma duodenale]
MSFALVFYTQSRLLHIGAKELCELTAGSVTSDGNLVEDEFDTTSPLENDGDDESSETGSSCAEKQLVTRLIKIEDMTAVATENIKALKAQSAALDQRIDHMEQTMRGVAATRTCNKDEGSFSKLLL